MDDFSKEITDQEIELFRRFNNKYERRSRWVMNFNVDMQLSEESRRKVVEEYEENLIRETINQIKENPEYFKNAIDEIKRMD